VLGCAVLSWIADGELTYFPTIANREPLHAVHSPASPTKELRHSLAVPQHPSLRYTGHHDDKHADMSGFVSKQPVAGDKDYLYLLLGAEGTVFTMHGKGEMKGVAIRPCGGFI